MVVSIRRVVAVGAGLLLATPVAAQEEYPSPQTPSPQVPAVAKAIPVAAVQAQAVVVPVVLAVQQVAAPAPAPVAMQALASPQYAAAPVQAVQTVPVQMTVLEQPWIGARAVGALGRRLARHGEPRLRVVTVDQPVGYQQVAVQAAPVQYQAVPLAAPQAAPMQALRAPTK